MTAAWSLQVDLSSDEVTEFARFVHPGAGHMFATPGFDVSPPADRVRAVVRRLMDLDLSWRPRPPLTGPLGAPIGQYPLRDPSSVLGQGAGTAIELAGVLAGCLMAAGVRPWVVFAKTAGTIDAAFVVVDVSRDVRWDRDGVQAGVSPQQIPWGAERDGAASRWLADLRLEGDLWILDAARIGLGHDDPGPVHRDDADAFLDRFDDVAACDLAGWHVNDCVAFPLAGLPWLDPVPEPVALGTPVPTPGDAESGGDVDVPWLCDAANRIVGFQPSSAVSAAIARVTAWADEADDDPDLAGSGLLGWVPIVGASGTGKTRTALELIEHLHRGDDVGAGSAGIIRGATVGPTGLNRDMAEVMMRRAGRVVLYVDDVEALPRHALDGLLAEALRRPRGWGPVIVVVTAPRPGAWAALLQTRSGPPLATVDLDGTGRRDLVDPSAVFARAAGRFAELVGWTAAPPTPPARVREMNAGQATAAAALAVTGQRPADPARVIDAVLDHEDARRAGSCGVAPNRAFCTELDEIAAIVSLCPALRHHVPPGDGGYRHADEVATVLERFVPADTEGVVPWLPDPFADRLVARALRARPDGLWDTLVAAFRDPVALETFLVTAARVWADDAPRWIDDLLDRLVLDGDAAVTSVCVAMLGRFRSGSVTRWVTRTLDGTRGGDTLAAALLDEGVAGHETSVAIAVARHLLQTDPGRPTEGRALALLADAHDELAEPDRALDLGAQAVDTLRRAADGAERDAATVEPWLIGALLHQAERQERIHGATGSTFDLYDEAVRRLRDLAAAEPLHRVDFALLLAGQAARLGEHPGRREDALACDEEAIAVLRQYPEADPRIPFELACIINNRADRLVAQPGRVDEAIRDGDEAIAMLRDVVAADPLRTDDLAAVLTRQAARLAVAPGRLDEAVGLGAEAIAILRRLAADDDRHVARLGDALDQQADRLIVSPDRVAEAIELGDEAVRITRLLVEVDLDTLPLLADALRAQARRLGRVPGRHVEALRLGDEAIDIVRPLASGDPRAQPALAEVLIDQARLTDAVDTDPTRAALLGREAIRVARAAAARQPAANLHLAVALSDQARRLQVAEGQLVAAVDAGEEAIDVFRTLAETDDRYRAELANALAAHAERAGHVRGHLGEAIAAGDEAVGILTRVAAVDPTRRLDLAYRLDEQADRLDRAQGRAADAAAVGDRAVATMRDLDAASPDAVAGYVAILRNQATRLDRGEGRVADARSLGEEAVGIARRLAADDPAHLVGLVALLDEQANRLANDPGSGDAAVVLGAEAVALCRTVPAEDPPAVQRLAGYLGNQANRVLGRGGRDDEAVALGEESIDHLRRLVMGDRRYRPLLADALDQQANRLDRMRRRREARTLRGTAAQLRGR